VTRPGPEVGATVTVGGGIEDVRRLIVSGKSSAALELIDYLVTQSSDPHTVARAETRRLAALLNLDRIAELPPAVDRAFTAVQAAPAPATMGLFHALAGMVAHLRGSLERCVTHLVRGARMLEKADTASLDAADGWRNLAIAYSIIGFHGQALDTAERSRQVAAAAGLPASEYGTPEIRIRLALSLDHRGDTDGCLRVLRDVVADLRRQAGRHPTPDSGLPGVPPCDHAYLGYAVARLHALGEPTGLDPAALFMVAGHDASASDLRQLGAICTAIAQGRPDKALEEIRTCVISPSTLGQAEIARLKSLAFSAAGDPVAAHAADRQAFRLTGQPTDRLRDLFVEGVAARIDHEDLRRTVARYADEALTDPLTGLPNRRHLEQHVEMMSRQGVRGVLGVVDLDAFKAVNTVHGHLSGDLVLQRVAGILARMVRRGDFVARFGGDEFVVVLPGTTLTEAHEIGRRLALAVSSEDWDALVPGTPVGVSVGWAELDGRAGLTTAFELADRAMLDAKRALRAS